MFVRLVAVAALATALQQPQPFWPPAATRDCARCRPLGMGEFGGAPALFLAYRGGGDRALAVTVGRDAALAMERACRGDAVGKVATLSVAQGLVNRDGGVFDNLPYELAPTAFAKKDLFDRVKGKDWPGRSLAPGNVVDGLLERWGAAPRDRRDDDGGGSAPPYRGAYGFRPAAESEADRAFAGYASPYALLLEAIGDMLNCDVAEALLEDACPLDDVFELAGAVRLVERGGGGVHVVDCYADEALGLALAAQCAVHAGRDVVDACGVSPTYGLERRTAVAPLKLRLRADDDRPRASAGDRGGAKPEEVRSGADYEALSVDDKLRCLLASDEFERRRETLPRPRALADDADGPVDALLLPLVDEIVRREVRIEAALRDGDVGGAARLIAGKSDRHKARDRARAASAGGDLAAEASARSEDAILTAIRADVTQEPGSYDPYLDQDRWYEEQRRRLS